MSQEIKRWDVHVRGDCNARGCNPYPDAFESETGIWVDYNDHVRTIDALARRVQELEGLIRDLQAHSREMGWQDYDEPIAALISIECPAPPVTGGPR